MDIGVPKRRNDLRLLWMKIRNWSVARGLARKVNDYKDHLAACDMARATISTVVDNSVRRS